MGTYSIDYMSPDHDLHNPYGREAVDWDWIVKGEWARSEMGMPGTQWRTEKGFDAAAYKALLEHFGLEQWPDNFPPERIIFMSPGDLARARRNKEDEFQLPRKEMTSDTIGYHAKAEDHYV